MKATQQDIANQLGISRIAVSYALNGSPKVGEKTRNRVFETARKLGYQSNGAAVAMAKGRFNNIALLQSAYGALSYLPEDLLDGIQDSLADRGMNLMLSKLPDDKLVDNGYVPKILSDIYADGLLVNYNARIPEKMIKLIHQHQIPAVWVNSKQKANCIYPDDFDGSYTAARHLIELGHQRIGFIYFGSHYHYSGMDRFQGYEKAMQEAGLNTFFVNQDIVRFETADESKKFLNQANRPTAVITYSDKETFGVYTAALSLGLKVPEDLSIISFGPRRVQHVDMVATSIILPENQIGSRAVEMLMERINNPNKNLAPEKFKCHLEIGNTTGKPNATALA